MENNPLTNKQCEELATEIFNFLVDNELWQDTKIYFNGKSWSTWNKETNEFYYNQRKYYEKENDNPRDYFEYAREPNILSMSFEGPLYEVLNGYYGNYGYKLEDKFLKIFDKYNLYYELGDAWNLTACEA